MRVWKVATPDQIRDLVRVGAFVKGKVLSVEGDKVILDFGEFVGEGVWEATQSLPSEGDVVLVKILSDETPIPLKFVRRLKVVDKELEAKRLPPVSIESFDDEHVKRELAALLKLAAKVAEISRQSEHAGAQQKQQVSLQSDLLFVVVPLVVEQRQRKLYMVLDRSGAEKGSVFQVRILLQDTLWGDLRVDMVYYPDMGKRLIVNFTCTTEEANKQLRTALGELQKRLESDGFTPHCSVFCNPDRVSVVTLLSRSALYEGRA